MNHPPQDSHFDVLNYSEWPELEKGQTELEFHLIYQGKLPAASQSSTRARDKQDIRKVFHRQLASLWNRSSFLLQFLAEDMRPDDPDPNATKRPRHNYANMYQRCGYRFIPLVSKYFMVSCSLNILFLRREGPGSLIKSGGDIDNRLKVLFDALRMPQTCDEVCGDSPDIGEDPFYCLLEDDNLISKVSVETNWLLAPLRDHERLNDVHLIIGVKTIVTDGLHYETAFH